ncbi:CD151 antigen-like [Pomacea canaliculata]|uniref:CD151 antigen-like n=1 Tax=Pomacea canaliculata TaxID=400727 RepID=UPI000D72934F|nr:CD151 antigen-like [Pomacea canaliculata]
MACGPKIIITFLIIFNVLLMLAGLALLGIGIWSVVDKVYISDVIGNNKFSAASYMIIVGGAILLGIGIFGIFVVRSESRALVIVYFILLIVLFVGILLAAILAIIFKQELEEAMIDAMRQSLVGQYGADSTITQSWDRLQRDLRCCAVRAERGSEGGTTQDMETIRQDSWPLYKKTRWYQNARGQDFTAGIKDTEVLYVPITCCVFDEVLQGYINQRQCQSWKLGPPGNYKASLKNNALYYDGCYEKAKAFIEAQSDIIVGCAFAFAFSMIGGLVLTVLLFRTLARQTREL